MNSKEIFVLVGWMFFGPIIIPFFIRAEDLSSPRKEDGHPHRPICPSTPGSRFGARRRGRGNRARELGHILRRGL